MKGIDVSFSQASIDRNAVKASGKVDFAITRAGYGRYASQKDEYFEDNYAGAKAAGIPVGAYWYSYATTEADAVQEAQACLECIKNKTFEYPIYFVSRKILSSDLAENACPRSSKRSVIRSKRLGIS